MESHPGVDDAGGAPAWIGEWPTTNSHMYLVYTTYYASDNIVPCKPVARRHRRRDTIASVLPYVAVAIPDLL